MLESKIQKKIIDYLHGLGAWTVKTIQCNKSGVPDIIACVPMTKEQVLKHFETNDTLGVFVGAEVKTEKGVISSVQKRVIKQINYNGGICGVVRSVEDTKELLKKM